MRDNLGFIASLRDYGPLVKTYLQPGQPTIVINRPDLIRSMLVDLAPSLDKGRFFETMGQVLGGDSVVTAVGAAHVRACAAPIAARLRSRRDCPVRRPHA